MNDAAHLPPGEEPVRRRELLAYGAGCLGNTLAGISQTLLTPLTVLVLGMSPLLAGLIMSIKTLWDAITDPLMATITDNANTRWGRRRPFIAAGGMALVLVCVGMWFFAPVGDRAKPNVAPEGSVAAAKSPAKPAAKPAGGAMRAGLNALAETSPEERRIFFYLLAGMLLVATAQTVYSVPYYALGIELSPTYNGRTRVVAYRSIFEKIMGLVSPWYLPFCMMAVFPHAVRGAAWLSLLVAGLALPLILLTAAVTRERTQVDKARKKVAMFASIVTTVRNRHFLKIAALYIVLQLALGLFLQFGLYINIFHVFGGDRETAMKFGALMQAKVSMLGAVLAIAAIPFITWVCRRFEKHNALRLALGMMATGCVLNWFCYRPGYPYLQFVLPFFFSLGISSTYTVLATLMADVTDVDELNSGTRREGMFGAVMAWMSKGVGSLQALMAGALLVATGFDAQASAQSPETVLNMRLLNSFAAAGVLVLAMGLLYRYPLTRARMEAIRQELEIRRRSAHVE